MGVFGAKRQNPAGYEIRWFFANMSGENSGRSSWLERMDHIAISRFHAFFVTGTIQLLISKYRDK